MKETTEKIRQQAIKELEKTMEFLLAEGISQKEAIGTVKKVVDSRIDQFYKKNQVEHIGAILKDILLGGKADSQAEVIFYELLVANNIKFKFQYKIGPYRVDYLINDDLVIELDGPQHNKDSDEKRDSYLRKMGYFIIRIPIWILAIDPQAAIEEVKERLPL